MQGIFIASKDLWKVDDSQRFDVVWTDHLPNPLLVVYLLYSTSVPTYIYSFKKQIPDTCCVREGGICSWGEI